MCFTFMALKLRQDNQMMDLLLWNKMSAQHLGPMVTIFQRANVFLKFFSWHDKKKKEKKNSSKDKIKTVYCKTNHWTRTLSSFNHFSSSCLRPCWRTGLQSSRDSNLLSWPWSSKMPKYWSKGDVWPGWAGTLWNRRMVSGVRRIPWRKKMDG